MEFSGVTFIENAVSIVGDPKKHSYLAKIRNQKGLVRYSTPVSVHMVNTSTATNPQC